MRTRIHCNHVVIDERRHIAIVVFLIFNSAEFREEKCPILYFLPPGTLWCGNGNIANGTDELGSWKQTDACCRTHDMCPDLIEAHGSKHGLTNPADYTRFLSNFLLILRAFPAVLFTAKPAASVLNQRDVSFLARSYLEAVVFKLVLPRSDALSRAHFPRP